jgi:hypothetical protein
MNGERRKNAYLAFVTGRKTGGTGKGLREKKCVPHFCNEESAVSGQMGLCFEEGEKRKSVYLTFVTARRRSKATKTEVRDSRKTVGTG